MAGTWSIQHQGAITVRGSGNPNEEIQIVVSKNGTQVAKSSTRLNAEGSRIYVFVLPPGTYDMKITAPSPGGTVHNYPGQIVAPGPPPAIHVMVTAPSTTSTKQAPIVTSGQGSITVTGTGSPGEPIQIVVSQNGMPVKTVSGNLGAGGTGTITITPLSAGTYDVEVTAPSPNGTVFDFPGQVVS
jgi:hypothetical protein